LLVLSVFWLDREKSWRGVQVDAGLPEDGAMSDMIRLP
jgi:hypothetical protein